MDLNHDLKQPDDEVMNVDDDIVVDIAGESMKLSELLENNFSQDLDFERELERNNDVFEKLIFERDSNENADVYNVLDQPVAEKVLKAIKNLEQGRLCEKNLSFLIY